MASFNWRTFLGGVAVGAVGLALMKAPEANKVYEDITTAVLIGRDAVLRESEKLSARAQDVYEVARIRADRYEEKKKSIRELEAPVVRGIDE